MLHFNRIHSSMLNNHCKLFNVALTYLVFYEQVKTDCKYAQTNLEG